MMKTWKKVCLYIFGVIIILVGLAAWGLNKLADGLCGNQIIEEVLSPNGNSKVTVFERNCGATTDFSTQISIMNPEKALPNKAGNLFIADTDRDKAPSGPGGGPKVEVTWKNNNMVIIKHHNNARIFKAESKLKNINVSYEIYELSEREHR